VTDNSTPRGVKRILVAEDNPALALVVQMHLEHAGYSVKMAINGRQAWELLQAGTYDLLLADQQMPEMCGTDLCRRVRQDPRMATMPLVMFTAKGLEMERQSVREELGLTDILPKPFSLRELVDLVGKCLECTENSVTSGSAAGSPPCT
jgi:two-component system, chemotaxis family, chemotaxis protein CheY